MAGTLWFGRAEGSSLSEIVAKREGQLVVPQPELMCFQSLIPEYYQ